MNILIITRQPQNISTEWLAQVRRYGTVRLVGSHNITSRVLSSLLCNTEIALISPGAISRIEKNAFFIAKRLQCLILLSAGSDWVDLEAIKKKNIAIYTCSGANAQSVAEYTWALILTLAKKIEQNQYTLSKATPNNKAVGIELQGKTIGVIGTGTIGCRVAKMAKAFGMHVLGYNKNKMPVAGIDRIVDLSTLLREADVVTIHIPLTVETMQLINKEEVAQMKPGVILVNTSREKIVYKQAIMRAIEQKKIFGFGQDLDSNTTLKANDPYLKHSTVYFSHHSGYNTKEAKERTLDLALEHLRTFASTFSKKTIHI